MTYFKEEYTLHNGKKIYALYDDHNVCKVTKECWRLMDFTDEDFEKAAAVNSNTQLYKQAGNSIVKNVLCEVFKQMM